MKPRKNRILPQTLVVCAAPLITFSTASADVLNFNEANTTNVWTLPAGTNLLSGATAIPATANTHESSSSSWVTLTDGVLGAPGDNTKTVTPNNNDTVVFPLDIVAKPEGYDLTSFDSYCTWVNSGRSNQDYTIQYSTVADPTNFITLAVVTNHDNGGSENSTHTNLTDTTGVLATGVHSIKIIFGSPIGQENGYVGYGEFFASATPSNVNTLVESNTGNAWTLPAGTNLLNGTTATPATTNTNEGSSPNWTTVTNGALGAAGDISASVTPPNDTSVTFPLDLSVNFNGYRLSSLDFYCSWPNSGRDNQDFSVSYSTVAAPATFIPLATSVAHTGSDNATHVRITPVTGSLAIGVAAIKLNFGIQENGFVGYREFIALGSAMSLTDPLTWTGGSGSAGSANWISGADSNWKKTVGGAAANFNPLAALTFDSTASNRNITVSTALTASSLVFSNDAAHAFTFGGQLLTVSNDVLSSGAGSTTFNNAVKANGVALSGAGSLTFNGALESTGLTVSGSGGVTLNAANPALTGSSSVSGGSLTVSNDNGLQNSALVTTGGVVRFTSVAPHVASIAGPVDTFIVLGKTAGPVNTNLFVGDASAVTNFAGNISSASGAVGSFTKSGTSTLVLSGVNTYTGTTTVSGGLLRFDQRLSLYNGNSASWTAGNLLVGSGGTLALKVGTFDEFTEADVTGLALGGFQPGSTLGISNAEDFILSRNLTQPGMGLLKTGSAILNLTGNNTSNGLTKIFEGTVNAASTGGTAIGGSILFGNANADVFLNFGGDNQVNASSVWTMANGSFYQTKVNLRGTSQVIAGLDSAPFPANRVSLIQNDENTQPGYPGVPLPATLTITTTTDHSFAGIIRNGVGGNTLSVVKNGTGVQEFRNLSGIQGYAYDGPTSLNEGTLRINFGGGNTEFGSNITIAAPATLNFHAVAGNYAFDRIISGLGKVVIDGSNAVVLTNGANAWTGGTTVNGGFLALAGNGSAGEGTGTGQTSVGGAMAPSNVINLINTATLSLDGIAPLGNSNMLPQFGPSIRITEGSKLFGGTNTVAFVPNITLDGGKIEITSGAAHGGFNTDIALVGTVVVDGSSTVPAEIHTTGTGDNANASLGSVGLPGTVFQVANVTTDTAADLTVSSVLRDVLNLASPLTKTGPGTMQLVGAKTYTGTTSVVAGELQLDTAYLADIAGVSIDAAGTLNLQFAGTDTIASLTLAGVAAPAGTYAAVGNGGAGITETARITGTGRLLVTGAAGPSYESWAMVIPNAADRDRTDDPDGDGFTNLTEFLFGTSPITNTGSLAKIEKSGSNLIVRWNQRATGGSVYVLQQSTTLVDPWTASPATITDGATQDLQDYVRKEAVIPVDSVRKFVRVQGTE